MVKTHQRRVRAVRAALVAACALVAAACGTPSDIAASQAGAIAAATAVPDAAAPDATTAAACASGAAPPARYDHVVWIWMENHSFSSVIGSSSAPYENALAHACGLATNYHSITHPSLPNYIAATSGSTHSLSSDCGPTSCPVKGRSIFGQVRAAGRTAKSYEEAMPTPCLLQGSGRYAPRHNPAVYYADERASCTASDIPLGSLSSGPLASDLAAGRLPAFSFITPDLCHDTHDCSVSTGDTWLSGWMHKLIASSAYQAGRTAIVITWDEGAGGSVPHGGDCLAHLADKGCRVAAIVVSPTTHQRTATGVLSHYSLLRTTEDLLGLPRLGHAADASTASMRAPFNL